MDNFPVYEISRAIELAVAPAFLLAGIAGILSILSHRLSRVVDRTRKTNQFVSIDAPQQLPQPLSLEIRLLARRTRVINWAIRLSVCSALTTCVVIICLFIGDFKVLQFSIVIALLFFTAMLLVILSLFLLLIEVNISTRNLENNIEKLLIES